MNPTKIRTNAIGLRKKGWKQERVRQGHLDAAGTAFLAAAVAVLLAAILTVAAPNVMIAAPGNGAGIHNGAAFQRRQSADP